MKRLMVKSSVVGLAVALIAMNADAQRSGKKEISKLIPKIKRNSKALITTNNHPDTILMEIYLSGLIPPA